MRVIMAVVTTAFTVLCCGEMRAQRLMGVVVENNAKGKEEPLAGATVFWLGTQTGTSSRENGVFLLDRVDGALAIVVSFVGYKSDTVFVTTETNIKVVLKPDALLQEVTVEGWVPTTHADHASAINSSTMNEKELFKAACCNLSESFETNPSVDVAFTDAVTGTRQIQMLGLSGSNTMISLENMPAVRGLASSQGIQLIPGTWINSIQVTKGVGSVINGYESIAGQINVELKKPQESDHLYVNGYVNSSGRSETNLVYTLQTSAKWGTTFLLHGSARPLEMDQNKDSFLDFPKGNQINFVNRWVFNSGNGWLAQFSFKYLKDEKQGGQTHYHENADKFTSNRYGLEINTNRTEFTGKVGYQFASKPYKSFGLQLNGINHDHDSYFGFRTYVANEQSVYANLIYQSVIVNTTHKFKTGLSFLYDHYNEKVGLGDENGSRADFTFLRTELVPGAFFEYSYSGKKVSMIAGIRVDNHNLFGTFVTPRFHFKYDLLENTSLRVSAGRGVRVANLIAENIGFMASSRALVFSHMQSAKGYGFNPDKAWNYGLNLTQDFTIDYRPGSFSIDYFYTDFQNQVVVDYDANPQQVNFFGLTGRSWSQSIQLQADYQLARRFDLRIAYRMTDVETNYLSARLRKPLVPRDRAFANLAYATRNNWKFDFTIQRTGIQRLPQTASNPTTYRLPSNSPAYLMLNTQVTKDFGTKWSVYAGVENLNNFRLISPIISASDLFGPYFDTSMAWGPIFGRMYYAGVRYRLK